MTETLYDTLIVGGGPAGLSAALHLAWHDRSVLVLDRATGPLFYTFEKLYNVPGMPEATGIEIQKSLKAQALARGAKLKVASVVKAEGVEGDFRLTSEKGDVFRGRTLLLATGAARFHPLVDGDFEPCFAYAGKGNLFYCPDCEAPEIKNKDTIVIGVGKTASAAAMALGLSRYTDRLRVLATGEGEVGEALAERLVSRGIAVRHGRIKNLVGATKRTLAGLELEDGETLAAEAFFVSSPTLPRIDLIRQLGIELAATGLHAHPQSQRGDTNMPGVWIAGDLRPMTQQVSVAMGTGNIAAVMIDQHLRRQDVA
jgi:thioredoxin reductase (NADPH)